MRRVRVAALLADLDGASMARCYAPLDRLERDGKIDLLGRLECFSADVVILHRLYKTDTLETIREMQRHGIRVVVNLDDDIFALPDYNPAHREYRSPQFQAAAKKTLKQANALFVSTARLASRMGHYNPRTILVRNGISSEMYPFVDPASLDERDRVTIGFAGSPSHAGDLELLRGVFRPLAEEFANVRFTFLGGAPKWLREELSGPYEHTVCSVDFVSVLAYPKLLGDAKLDIGLAPLQDNDFNKARSCLKFLEYSSVAAVTVASAVGPFPAEITQGVDGFTVDNRRTSWLHTLRSLISDRLLRRSIAAQAQKKALTHDVSITAGEMYDAILDLNPDLDRRPYRLSSPVPAATAAQIDIVLPVFNAAADARAAVENAKPELTADRRLVIVDDCSTDEDLAGWLFQQSQDCPHISYFRTERNLGFVASCNWAVKRLTRVQADIILHNSDAVPMRGFVERLTRTAYSLPTIGSVTAVADHGSVASLPAVSDAAEVLASMDPEPVVAPTAVGHLMYVKREVIRQYGFFDAAFGRGYGEENDFSLRIRDRYRNVIDPGCWTRHKATASFTETEKRALQEDHLKVVVERYPSYPFEVASWSHSDPLRNERRELLARTSDSRPRVLHVAHSYRAAAGTEKHIRDLECSLSDRYLSFAVAPEASGTLELFHDGIHMGSRRYAPADWPITPSETPRMAETWASIFDELQPDVIHVHHMLRHPLGVLDLLYATGVPIVVSLHDYYFLCPEYTLRHCPGVHECESCFPKLFGGHVHPDYQLQRREIFRGGLAKAAAIVAPSRYARDKFLEVYAGLDVEVIEHGIEPALALPRAAGRQDVRKNVRFGFVGNLTPQKGIETLLDVFPSVHRSTGAELHIWGWSSSPRYLEQCGRNGIVYHGPYRSEDLPRIAASIDVALIPSEFAETFCYTLSEMAQFQVPVIVSDIGALGERVSHGVTGLTARPGSRKQWKDVLSAVAAGEIDTRSLAWKCAPRTIWEMADDYDRIYRDAIAGSRAAAPVSQSPFHILR